MSGHAHIEVEDGLSLADFVVLAVLVLLLFTGALYILRQLKKWCIKYIQREIQREVEAAQQQQMKTLVNQI